MKRYCKLCGRSAYADRWTDVCPTCKPERRTE